MKGIESFEVMSSCIITSVLKKLLGIKAELCCLTISKQGKPPETPLYLRYFRGLAAVRKDLQETRVLWGIQMELDGVPREPPLPAAVLVPAITVQPSTQKPFKENSPSSLHSRDGPKVEMAIGIPRYSPLFLLDTYTSIYRITDSSRLEKTCKTS